MCHSKLIKVRNDDHNFSAIYGICGVRGTLQVVNNKVKFGHADELMKISLKPNPNILKDLLTLVAVME